MADAPEPPLHDLEALYAWLCPRVDALLARAQQLHHDPRQAAQYFAVGRSVAMVRDMTDFVLRYGLPK